MKKRKFGIIDQMLILAVVGVIIVGVLTYFAQYSLADRNVHSQMEDLASDAAEEVSDSVREYPAYEWLLKYWYDNADTLDVEYDVDYRTGTKTQEKYAQLTQRHPQLQLQYADTVEIEALPAEDQKLYAEVVYSWLTTRINQIKRSHDINYLFCVVTDTDEGAEPYQTQLFLFSGAEPGDKRGTDYLEVYTLGTFVSVADNENQQQVMRDAVIRANTAKKSDDGEPPVGHLAIAGAYVDYYEYIASIRDRAVLVGMTYDLSDIFDNVNQMTWLNTSWSELLQIILLLIVMLHIFFYVIRPLKRELQKIRLYTKTKDSKDVAPSEKSFSSILVRNNEIGQLSDDIVTLAKAIDEYTETIETITAQEQRIETELNMAARIQASMMPHEFPPFPDKPQFDIYATMDPAKEVGGDFYDFFLIDEDHVGIVIADVSGKGVPASLFMMSSKINLQRCAMHELSAAQILTKTNEAICSNNKLEMFVTTWLGILEISTGKLTAANAGHEYPVLKKPDGSFELFRDKHGFVIGGMEGAKYKEYELQLEPGSKIFVYSDGLPEATDADGERFGTERMLATLNSGPTDSPEAVIQHVMDVVNDFAKDAEQFDDLTMLCLEYRGTLPS